MPDPTNVGTAIVAKLAADATLMALMTDGVHMNLSPSGKTKYVIVSLVTNERAHMFGATAFDEPLYLVKAVEKTTSRLTVKAAAARIDALLDYQPLTVTGYAHSLTRRAEDGVVDYAETDDPNPDVNWLHLGARYEIFVSPS